MVSAGQDNYGCHAVGWVEYRRTGTTLLGRAALSKKKKGQINSRACEFDQALAATHAFTKTVPNGRTILFLLRDHGFREACEE
jgi:hypothetical protein